jgi:TPR repeat protein
MSIHRVWAAAAAAMLAWGTAQADFQAALGEYRAGHFDSAHQQFLALAELGDCSSQFNLGAMALQGQGGAQDTGSGVGWLEAAVSNGCQQLVGNKLQALSAKLSAEQQQKAAAILARYGRDALQAQGIISPDLSCRDLIPPKEVSVPQAQYPDGQTADAIVIAALTIGRDGRVRDPEILQAIPAHSGFAKSALEAWLNSVYAPAQRNGQTVSARVLTRVLFVHGAAAKLADEDPYKQARPAAQNGDAAAEYLIGLTSTVDSTLGVPSEQGGRLLLAAARDGDPQAQYWIGAQQRATLDCHPHADGDIWLRHAAAGGNAAAQMTLARELLSSNPAQARTLLEQAATSDNLYVRKHVAAMLATAPSDAARDPITALNLARQVAEASLQPDPQVFEVLAAAYAVNGDYQQAVSEQKRALNKAEMLGWNTPSMHSRMASYRANQAWSGDIFAD